MSINIAIRVCKCNIILRSFTHCHKCSVVILKHVTEMTADFMLFSCIFSTL